MWHQSRSDQSLSRVRLFATPWIAAHQASLSITISQSSLKLISIESVMPSSHLILCRPLLLLSPIPPSIRVFSNESTLRMRWPKYWSFSFSIISSKEIPGLISFRMDWLDLLAVKCGIAGSFQVLSQGCDQNASPGRRLTWGLQCRRNHFHAPSPARWLQASLNSLNVGLSLGQDVVAGFPQSKQEKASTQKSQPF